MLDLRVWQIGIRNPRFRRTCPPPLTVADKARVAQEVDPERAARRARHADGLRGGRARFDAALAQVARNTRGPLAEEFARTLQEIQIGLSLVDALRGMVARTTVAELRGFVSALVQASELGIPVARVLREQASEMRIRRSGPRRGRRRSLSRSWSR